MKEVLEDYPGCKVAFEQLQYSKMRPTAASYHEIEDLMVDKIYTMMNDSSMDIQKTLDALAEQVNKILSR